MCPAYDGMFDFCIQLARRGVAWRGVAFSMGGRHLCIAADVAASACTNCAIFASCPEASQDRRRKSKFLDVDVASSARLLYPTPALNTASTNKVYRTQTPDFSCFRFQ